jgi:hypothetical protein
VRPVTSLLMLVALAGYEPIEEQGHAQQAQVVLKGSMVCNGACIPDPKSEDHLMVLFAIDGTSEIHAEVDRIMKEFYPESGLDAVRAQKLMDQFCTRLKFFIAPDSPALRADKNRGKNHYCEGAKASAVTGVVTQKAGNNNEATHFPQLRECVATGPNASD